MKPKSFKIIAALAGIAVFFVSPARAILGLGDVVFDPSNYAQAIKSFIQLQQQYAQLIVDVDYAVRRHDQMPRMAKTLPVNIRAHYRTAITP
jgi:conjugal transfer/entry exclusion protein